MADKAEIRRTLNAAGVSFEEGDIEEIAGAMNGHRSLADVLVPKLCPLVRGAVEGVSADQVRFIANRMAEGIPLDVAIDSVQSNRRGVRSRDTYRRRQVPC